MDNKSTIRQLLDSAGIKPQKRRGQHFLIDLNLMNLLVHSANISNQDVVLEVGSGTGSLTQELCERAARVIAVELDPVLAEIAKRELSKYTNLRLINADILKNKNNLNPEILKLIVSARKKIPGRFLLVANLPYDIASALIINLILGPVSIDAFFVTVQKEVAERMNASSWQKNYSTLSIYLSASGIVDVIRELNPEVFWPQPKVKSAMVRFIKDRQKLKRIKNLSLFTEIVNLFMQHRRKMLKSCTKFAKKPLKDIGDWSVVFAESGINPTHRPAQLSPQEYITLANRCAQLLNKK